jgi:pyruvate,water dikinase
LIISLEKIRDHDLPLIGNKAFGLARMSQIGLKVPSGFCITATAFREHLETNKLIGFIESAAGKLNSASSEARKSILLEIRQAIINAPVAGKLRSEIENHYQAFAANRVAVRSSATAEDLPGHSFAGQYETYLGIADLAGCIDAVKKCWASLWTERAYEYRQKNGFDHLAVNMAVIVQSLIEADASGVIFTADPVNGYKSRMIIEAVPGLGDALVSGKATPQRFVVAKRKCRIVSKNLTSKSHIADSVVKRLAKLGKKVEKHFESPQDIEWAISNNKIFFLQTRPITTTPQQKSWEERQVWTNANTGEVAPDVITPVTWSIMQKFANAMFAPFVSLVSVEIGDHPVFGLVAGRVYCNLNTGVAFARHFPEMTSVDADMMFGGEHGKIWELIELSMPDENLPDLHFSLVKTLIKLPISLARIFSFTEKKAVRFIDNIRHHCNQLDSLSLSSISEAELAVNFSAAVSGEAEFTGLMFVARGFGSFLMLNRLCRKWFGEKGNAVANSLFSGMSNIESAEAGLDLCRLSLKAHEIEEVQKIILTGNKWQIIRDKIASVDRGVEFLKIWDQFMVKHGHHCRGEYELFNPRWSENPDYILDILRNYNDCMDKADNLKRYNKLAETRLQITMQCRQKLKNPVKRWVFSYLLRTAQRGSVLRENWKSQTVRFMAALRKIILELGQRLHYRGTLANADDIFFLKFEELELVTQNKPDFDVKKVISTRRGEYEKNMSLIPPKVVIGKFDTENYTPDVVDTNAEVLNGLAVSSGVVTGKARVILRADMDQYILPGEILVAPFTDPGWTPYFMPAAAIVMDIGGMLSHGSIIAREYGIPAVVNVGPATKIIKTGQTIQVDANRGIVRIIR